MIDGEIRDTWKDEKRQRVIDRKRETRERLVHIRWKGKDRAG